MAVLMAGYNRLMNTRMYDAAARLDPADVVADKGAFFGSILGTLNHIAVADTIWLHRFTRHQAGFSALKGLVAFPLPTSLTQSLAADLAGLRRYRDALDEVIVYWAEELRPAHMQVPLVYANMAGVHSSRPFGGLVQHFFNHQTHHRGQVSTLLFQSGVDVGVTDLLPLVPAVEA